MNRIQWLQARKAWELRYAAFLSGLPTTGTKVELANSLAHALARRLNHGPQSRIVSIDMGIKNLAICVLDIPREGSNPAGKNSPLKVADWKKVDILQQVAVISGASQPEVEAILEPKGRKSKSAGISHLFTPSLLSQVACSFTTELLETYKPSEILIERQRFRSLGASAVQEWTLRVNMFESMLWACFRMKQSISDEDDSSSNGKRVAPQLEEVSPARVANFWCSGSLEAARRVPQDLFEATNNDAEALWNQLARKKVEKKDKIAVVRSWLLENGSDPEINLEFGDKTRKIADAFLIETRRGGPKKGEQTPATLAGLNKLDDLADSMLQAVAWVRWAENRQSIRQLIDSGS